MSSAYVPRDPNAPPPKRLRKPKSKNKWGCGLFIVPLVLAAFYAFMEAKNWHPSDDDYPAQGIDISHHQGAIDWSLLPDQGVDFAYIKATEGGDFVDPRFAENWEAAGEAGIARGAYHFFTLCKPGAEQAANFIATVPRDERALPPVVDLEYMGNCSERPKLDDVRAELGDYLRLVEAHYGKPAVLYLTEEFDEEYAISENFDRPLWLRSLVLEPEFGARDWTFWQVSNFRQLEGMQGRVDWNVMQETALTIQPTPVPEATSSSP
ncbi:glycoside hydrolase family 25 protein [Qipengyuania polymorpha]|nr:glycoside hydrolase family 25 protein [Qipengyuania polymorpha]